MASPARCFRHQRRQNPPAEGRDPRTANDLVNYVQDKNDAEGMVLGWMGALAYRFATGREVEG